MNDYYLLPLTFLGSFVLGRLIIHFCHKLQWLDQPNSRSSHVDATPTSGGLAIVSSFTLAILVAFSAGDAGFNHYLVMVPALLIAGMGFADDLFNLGIWSRICLQFLVVVCALALFGIPSLAFFSQVLTPGLPGYLLAIVLFLWFINLFNFMDGIDGLAGSETVFFGLALSLFALSGNDRELATFTLLLVAAVSGFLIINLPPAKLFMGDVGSNFLGYLIGVITLAFTVSGITSVWSCLILAGVFMVDATYTLCRRILTGEKWYYAHREHAYQRAADRLGSHGKVVIAVSLINVCWLLPMAWLAHISPAIGFLLLAVAWLPLLILVWQAGRLESTTPLT